MMVQLHLSALYFCSVQKVAHLDDTPSPSVSRSFQLGPVEKDGRSSSSVLSNKRNITMDELRDWEHITTPLDPDQLNVTGTYVIVLEYHIHIRTCMKNLRYHFPTCYAYSVKEPIRELNLKRAVDEDTGVFSSFFSLLSSSSPLGQTAVSGNSTSLESLSFSFS